MIRKVFLELAKCLTCVFLVLVLIDVLDVPIGLPWWRRAIACLCIVLFGHVMNLESKGGHR